MAKDITHMLTINIILFFFGSLENQVFFLYFLFPFLFVFF